MHLYLFDPANLRSASDFIAVPGPVSKSDPVADTQRQDDEWALDAFSGAVVQHEGRWRAYVTAFHRTHIRRSRPFLCESDDGLHWTRRGLVEFEHLPHGFDGYLKQPSVVRLDDQSYRMYVWCHGEWDGRPVGRLAIAHSIDGLKFRLERFEEPLLYHVNELRRWGFEPGLTPVEAFEIRQSSASAEDQSELLALKSRRSNDSTNIVRDQRTGQFICYSVFFLPNPLGNPRRDDRDNARSLLRVIARRESYDGLDFSCPRLVFTPDQCDPLDQQFYYLSPHQQDGYWFGFLGDYEIIKQTMDLGLAVSRDGISWTRPMRSPIIARDTESWDSHSIYCIDGLIDAGDDWLMLYRGGWLPHNAGSKSHSAVVMRVARVGKRRLIGMDTAANRDARLVTQPFILSQPWITLDADIRGHLRAEVCDPFGCPLAGFTRESFVPVHGDHRKHRLTWRDRDCAILQHEPISLRLEATDATLFILET